MNCQDALHLLYDIIDKEASEIDVREVEEHLKLCHHCSGIYRIEGSVQELVRERLKPDNPNPRLAVLQSKILHELDSIDRSRAGGSQERPPFFRLSTALVLAASLVLVVGAAFFVSDFYRHNTLYMPLEKSHFAVADQPAQVGDEVRTAVSMSHVSNDLHYAVSRSVNDFQLLGGRMEDIMGTMMAHFVFFSEDRECISVFVVDAAAFEIPKDLQGSAVTKGDLTFYDHHCRGCRLVYHRIGDVIVICAARERDIDLLSFVPGSLTT